MVVPTRTLTGERDISGSGVFCGLYGARDPWDRHNAGDPSDPFLPRTAEPVLSRLYPTHADYVSKVRAAAQASVDAGYLLPEDAPTIVTAAENSAVRERRNENRR
ncbi:alpha/beta hydrolase domain-containing protein [Microbispora sp. KK1-11]|uniref:alpha/beta hydrolase domain-containing protein n=1 Tax=Microbispora sp. KK1-11 TaxID=2053005 RepID=UPI00115B7C69|nr:hypothetical protein FLW16_10070 [Microbispora sp. KK1-11]